MQMEYSLQKQTLQMETPNGLDSQWFENGILKSVYNYTNGQINGDMETYYQSGQLESTGKWKYDHGNGKFTYYNINGVIDSTFMIEDGIKK